MNDKYNHSKHSTYRCACRANDISAESELGEQSSNSVPFRKKLPWERHESSYSSPTTNVANSLRLIPELGSVTLKERKLRILNRGNGNGKIFH